MLHSKMFAKSLNTVLLGLSLASVVSTSVAHAVPKGLAVERLLNSPGARELMDEEVQSWRSVAAPSARNDVVVGGSVLLRGTPSPAQRFNRGKLIRCDVRLIGGGQFAANRGACDVAHPVYLPMSEPGKDQPTAVTPGFYILGFENSVYPGFLQVKTGEQAIVELKQIAIPAGGTVKVYRDLNALTEAFKHYFSTYVLDQNVFKEAEYSFGDQYIKTFGARDGGVALDYKTCEATKLPLMTTKGTRVCRAWNMGTFMMLTEMFNIAANGSFIQWGLDGQGKPYPYPNGRLLVSRPTDSTAAPFINVLPGQYVIETTDAKGVAHAQATGPVGTINPANVFSMNFGWIPAISALKFNGASASVKIPNAIDPTADPNAPSAASLAAADPGNADDYVNSSETCSSAKLWRTELRAYCTNDSAPGCARSLAKVCEPMFDVP